MLRSEFYVKLKCGDTNHEMEVESMISTSATTASIILARNNPPQTPPRQGTPRRRRSSSSTSLSPGAKENTNSGVQIQNSSSNHLPSGSNISIVGTKRKRTKSSPASKCREKLTFWGWSPKKAKFKPKIMDERGELTDHPDPTAAIRSKWQPIVNNWNYYLHLLYFFSDPNGEIWIMTWKKSDNDDVLWTFLRVEIGSR